MDFLNTIETEETWSVVSYNYRYISTLEMIQKIEGSSIRHRELPMISFKDQDEKLPEYCIKDSNGNIHTYYECKE